MGVFFGQLQSCGFINNVEDYVKNVLNLFLFVTNRNVNIGICSRDWWEIAMKPVSALINPLLHLIRLDTNSLGKNCLKYLLYCFV